MDYPRAGIHYPRSQTELQTWFRTEADCLDYLDWLRWPGGFSCPSCAHAGGWRLGDGRYECAECNGRISVTAGTGKPLPAVRLIAAAATRWLLCTHQGSVAEAHLPAYLDEFVFRFNRRQSSNCGMAFYQVLELKVW